MNATPEGVGEGIDPAQWQRLPDPLPRRSLLGFAGVGGRIKERPEDFLVDELPLYAPCGSGEHLYLLVEKIGMPHAELMGVFQRHFGVGDEAIGFAGMKDKVAVTHQTISVQLGTAPLRGCFRLDIAASSWSVGRGNAPLVRSTTIPSCLPPPFVPSCLRNLCSLCFLLFDPRDSGLGVG